ncbi:MAG: hypothetical protein FJ267_14420 [Planctomycetes bacterium]|nr:hypothetical protein [Planctomycetota bacterium]
MTITCWGCKNEDFCLPGPSERDCKNCEEVCEPSKDPKSPGSCPKKFVWYSWTPSPCGKVYTKQKLMKRTVTKTLPSYKWVVEELCPQCQTNLTPVEATPTAEIPPAPTIPGAKVIGPVELTNAKAELLY